MRNHISLPAFLFFLSVQLFLYVAATPVAAREYSMAELFDLALREDSRLDQIEADVAVAETLVSDAFGSFQPDLSAGFRAAYTSELPEMRQPAGIVEVGVNDTYAANITARQLIFAGFARREGLAAAENRLAAERFQRTMREDALRFSLLQAAYGYSIADLSVESLEASLARLNLNRRRVESFFAQGFASELDLLEINATIDELKLQLRQQKTERNSALISLRSLSGADDLDTLVVEEAYLELPVVERIIVKEAALVENATYRASEYSLRAREIKAALHRGDYYPKLSAFGSLNYGRPGANFFADEWQFYYQAGIEISLNLWDGGSRGNALARDAARKEQVVAERRELFTALLNRGAQTEAALQSAEEQLSIATELLVNKQRKYELVQQLWEAGEQSTLEVLEAEQELTTADIRTKRLEISLLSLYQEYLMLINRPLWETNQ
ncbi:MAG: TolC family protein [Alkalispirochaeta sp.]